MTEPETHAPGNSDKGSLEPIRYINLYESADKIYTRRVTGFYQRLRRYTVWPLLFAFMIMPWLVIDGRPAILFDLPSRHFHILWLTLGPQDLIFLTGLLVISAFALFTVTALFGRVWCGFTCPQTVWTLMFIWVEHLCEGDRNQRIKLDAKGWSLQKIIKKGSKHSLWLMIALATGLTFVGYFYPIRSLISDFIPHIADNGFVSFEISPQTAFWTFFFTGMTYMNAGWLREQVCIYMCPYARFQSVMYDRDTVAVHYDTARGEPRGHRKPQMDKNEAGSKSYAEKDSAQSSHGDCIDCSWCVQVCPVDIDIRDGLQYSCINCGLCVDACDTVMDKMSQPRGLIRYTSEDELTTGNTRFLRPRALGYLAILLVVCGLFAYFISDRTALKVSINRDRSASLYQLRADEIHNVYTITIANYDNSDHIFVVAAESDQEAKIKGKKEFLVDQGEVVKVAVRVSIDQDDFEQTLSQTSKQSIILRVRAKTKPELSAFQVADFYGPGQLK